MTAGAPWSVKGIDPKAREIAKDLARRSGMTLGEWLNQMILEDGPEALASPPPPPEPRRRAAPLAERFGAGERVAPPVQRLRAEPMEEDDIAQVTEALDRLSARIEAAEHRSTLAISGIDQSVVGVLSRIEDTERQQTQVAARFEGAIDDVRTETETIESRLAELEKARSGARSAEALKSLEGALSRVASHLYEGESRTRDALSDLKRDVDDLADRVLRADSSNDPGGQAAIIEQVVSRIGQRLEQAEARTSGALRGLEGSFAHLDQRLRSTEAKLEAGAPDDRRFEQMAAELSARVEQVRTELAQSLKSTAETRFDRVEAALREMTGHVQAAEQRSAQAIERMGQEVVRMADTMNQRVQGVESRNAEAIEQVGGDVARMADAMEGRMRRADSAQAEALEKLGSEIARITERLAERIANAERRSAQSMDDVGEQVTRATERLQQRQERASSELVDRMRQSEERTAKILDEAREKIDQRLSEAQKKLAEQAPPAAPPPMAAYVDPYAAPYGAGGYGADPFASQDFGAAGFAGQGFPAGQAYPAQPFGQPFAAAPAPAELAPVETPAHFAEATPFDGPAAPPSFAPSDIEAAEDFDDIDDFAPTAEKSTTAFDEGFDAAAFEAAIDDAAPPEATRSSSTRDLIAQARAAARAASAPPEPKARKGGGGKAKEARESAPLFSGFGIGRKKAKAESSTLKTALLMSAAAAFLGLGAAGVVIQNGGAFAGWSNQKDAADPAADGVKIAADTGSVAAADELAEATPLDPRLALALAPTASTAPAAPAPEAQTLYSAAVGQIEGGDNSGLDALRRSANLGYAPAQYYLANLYSDGKAGLKKNAPEARRWTERAAANGEPRAMHSLATYYYYGEGGPQNPAAAVDWFKKAANLGWVDSQFNLAVLNEKGLGVRQNPAEAYKWFVIAGRNGDEPSRAKAAELKKMLSPSELAAADRAVASFRAEAPNPSARAAAIVSAPTLPGASTSTVATAQRALSRLGYYQGPADGTASPALRLAVAAYQRDQGLPPSGALTPELLQRFATATR